MSKETITINDFGLFLETLKPINKISPSVKMVFGPNGMKISTRNDIGRCEVKTNSVFSENEMSFCIGELGNLIKILGTVDNIHNGDFSGVRMMLDGDRFKIESKRFKTKLSLKDEEDITKYVDQGFKSDLSELQYDYEFVTNSDLIKRINSHAFAISDQKNIRVYVRGEADMGKNMIYATLGSDDNDFENSLTFEFGMVTNGVVGDDVQILNLDRINQLNVLPSDEIKIRKMAGRNGFLMFNKRTGKNNTFMNLSMTCSTLVK